MKGSYTSEWVSEEYGFNFHYLLYGISTGGFYNRSDITVDKEFLENSQTKVVFYGGDPVLANISSLDAWVKTIDKNTFPMNVTMIGLWNLITDNDQKQQTMENFIVGYLNNGFPGRSQQQTHNIVFNQSACLGAGIDTTKLGGCLANVYNPNSNDTFIQTLPDTNFVELSVIVQETFDMTAYYEMYYESSDFFGFGSDSEEIYKFYQAHYVGEKSLSKIVLQLSYYRMTAPAFPLPELNQEFTIAVDSLPIYDQTPATQNMYFQFLQTWGTAVIDEVILGGSFESYMWYDREYNTLYTEQEISESSSWSFAGVIGDGHGKIIHQSNFDQGFNESLTIEYKYIGGGNTFNMTQYLDWAETVIDNLQIVKYHLQPITYFITDKSKKIYVGMAVEDYTKMSIDQLDAYINSLNN